MVLSLTPIGVPFCFGCDTDEFLIYEEFTPARTLPSGEVLAVSVNYECAKCGLYSGHDVPAGWAPPAWFWYS